MGYADTAGPLALTHRGAGALAPENTIRAFEVAVGLGYRYVETDVRVTADGALVCFHDHTLDRATEGHGPLDRHTLRQVQALRVDGEPICTLDDALDAFPDTCFSVDLKDLESLPALVRTLHRPGVAARVCVAGAWDGWLRRVREQVPHVATSLGWRSLTALLTCARLGVRPPRHIATAPFAHVPLRLGAVPVFVARVLDMAHDLGMRVVTWTVDDAATITWLLDLGADAVITDRPDVLREVLIRRGQWQPMGVGGGAATGGPGGVDGAVTGGPDPRHAVAHGRRSGIPPC